MSICTNKFTFVMFVCHFIDRTEVGGGSGDKPISSRAGFIGFQWGGEEGKNTKWWLLHVFAWIYETGHSSSKPSRLPCSEKQSKRGCVQLPWTWVQYWLVYVYIVNLFHWCYSKWRYALAGLDAGGLWVSTGSVLDGCVNLQWTDVCMLSFRPPL